MPMIRPIRELQNTTEISHFAKTLNEPIFITKNGRNDLVLMNDAVYERIMAQNEICLLYTSCMQTLTGKWTCSLAELDAAFGAGLQEKMCIRDRNTNMLLGCGMMLASTEVPRIAGAFGVDTSTRANVMGAVHTAQSLSLIHILRGEKRPVRGDALIQVCKRKIHRYLFSNG